MSPAYFTIAVVAVLGLTVLLAWALRGGGRSQPHEPLGMATLERSTQHLSNMPQIQRAMDTADLEYVRSVAGTAIHRRVRRERRRVTLLFLSAVRRDFDQSLRLARIVAVLSPEVSGTHEYERLRLSIVFRARYQMVRTFLILGGVEMPQVVALGQMAASLAIRLEQEMAKLGERAALAAELAMRSER